jgi:transposase
VDDFAFRKGQRYGTILVDHERGEIVDLLPDRTPETLAQWLREHPGVEIVTRDRAEAYAQGITQGAPEAIQVADRWHLIKNVTEALASVLQEQRAAIQQQLAPAPAAPTPAPPKPLTPNADLAPTPPPPEPPTPAEQRRQARSQEMRALHARGWTQKEIAAHLHCHPRTMRRALRRESLDPAPRAARGSKLDPYKPYLLQRWNEGCHNAAQLLREIAAPGFDGRPTLLRAFVAELRVRSGMPARARTAPGQALPPTPPRRVAASRELAWLSTQPRHQLEEEQRALLSRLEEVGPRVKTAMELAQAFAEMVRHRQAEKLDGWLEQAAQSGIAALSRVATGIRADLAAVRAALTLVWSNGRTEGSVNRLKCVKRQMYGRGKLDLLRLRLIAT